MSGLRRCGPRKRGLGVCAQARILPLAGLWAALVAVTGCGQTQEQRAANERADSSGFRGVALPEPSPAPDFQLLDTGGAEFHFREETDGHLALLFFGYTNCPDICPVHLANLAAVLGDLDYSQKRRVKVVFVTTDPERDTPEHLRSWLDRIDRSFIGLVGDPDEVNVIQGLFNLPPAVQQTTEDGQYLVGHASQVLAITPDGFVRVVYPAGTRQSDWAHDLPRLLAFAADG
jgi:protein SCO1/2